MRRANDRWFLITNPPLIEFDSRAVEGCAPERRVVGLRQVDGMPHATGVVGPRVTN
jgi:hypothetical protein